MTTSNSEKHPLVGCGFHTHGDDGSIIFQGEFTADLGDGYFLATFFSWIDGSRSRGNVYSLAEIAALHPNGEKIFHIFQSLDEANAYYETRERYRDKRIRGAE